MEPPRSVGRRSSDAGAKSRWCAVRRRNRLASGNGRYWQPRCPRSPSTGCACAPPRASAVAASGSKVSRTESASGPPSAMGHELFVGLLDHPFEPQSHLHFPLQPLQLTVGRASGEGCALCEEGRHGISALGDLLLLAGEACLLTSNQCLQAQLRAHRVPHGGGVLLSPNQRHRSETFQRLENRFFWLPEMRRQLRRSRDGKLQHRPVHRLGHGIQPKDFYHCTPRHHRALITSLTRARLSRKWSWTYLHTLRVRLTESASCD
ncbi:hypothetical protein ABH940_006603 [Streptacidiphilus sp. BW17]